MDSSRWRLRNNCRVADDHFPESRACWLVAGEVT